MAGAADTPGPKKPVTVGIIGGGIAGLACARRLDELGLKAVVFDTGKHGPGGRASSRVWRGSVVDHAAQFITVTDPRFATAMAESGSVQRWGGDGRLGILTASGYTPFNDDVERLIGKGGFGSIVAALAKGIDVRQDVWVPPSNGIRKEPSGGWSVLVPNGAKGRGYANFDAVVVAHNGKCAERLTSSTPAREVHSLLRTNFADTVASGSPGGGRFTLNQVYSLLFELPSGVLQAEFDGAFIENEPSLRWLASNTAKFNGVSSPGEGSEVWTVMSSPAFGKRHKAPQEHLAGTPKEAEVIALLLDGIERSLKLRTGALRSAVTATKLQLWGAGLPINRWAGEDCVDFVWSAAHCIGIAGDWITTNPARASTVEAAWLSGVQLAEHIAHGSSRDAGLELGEDGGSFIPIDGDFGSGGRFGASWVTISSGDDKGKAGGWKGSRGKNGSKGAGKSKQSSGRGQWGAAFERSADTGGVSGKGKGATNSSAPRAQEHSENGGRRWKRKEG